jgi:hypothetical protein
MAPEEAMPARKRNEKTERGKCMRLIVAASLLLVQ